MNKVLSNNCNQTVVQYMLRDWDIRQAAVSGKRDRLIRWVFKYFEDATKQVRKYQGEGKNVTQFILLLDAEGFNPVNHGCALCQAKICLPNQFPEYNICIQVYVILSVVS